jgi:hypothetical protein
MEPTYRSTQRGTWLIIVLTTLIVICVPFVLQTWFALIPIGLFGLIAIAFSSLTTEVYTDRICVWFGPGWVRKEIFMTDVKAASAVTNKWYYGWGIRFIGNGWMYNLSGLDAVELKLTTGKRFRIGTDAPKELEEAIWIHLSDLDEVAS